MREVKDSVILSRRWSMSSLLDFAHRPALTLDVNQTVNEGVRAMLRNKVGAAAVVEGQKLVGIFSERDLMARVVLERRDIDKTFIKEVMTSTVISIKATASAEEALRIMIDRHIRHLPIVDGSSQILGMLSMRHLMTSEIESLADEVASLSNYISADGIGG
jgi:CBS domain-containing protein